RCLPFLHRNAAVNAFERLAQRPLRGRDRMLLEELLDLSAFLARAERTNGACNSRNALEDAERFCERVPVLLDEGPGGILRRGAAEGPANQRGGVLCSNVG